MIPLEGYRHFLHKSILNNKADLRVALVAADFDGEDRTLHFVDITLVDAGIIPWQVYDTDYVIAEHDEHFCGRIVSDTFTFQVADVEDLPLTVYGIAMFDTAPDLRLICLHKFDAPIVLSELTHKVERGIDFYDREYEH